MLGLGLFALPQLDKVRSRLWHLDRSMGGELHTCLAEIVAPDEWPQLVAVAVTIGPGSFTGCRMGVTVARTLGQSLGIPVFGVSALAAIAEATLTTDCDDETSAGKTSDRQRVAVCVDAKRGEYFGGIYEWWDGDLKAIVPDRLYAQKAWELECQDVLIVDAADWIERLPLAAVAAIAARRFARGDRPQWQDVMPFYGRKPPIHNG